MVRVWDDRAWPGCAQTIQAAHPKLVAMKWIKAWIVALLRRRRVVPVSDRQRAVDLVKAVDAGGLPLNPARVNAIARSLGLEVSIKAPVEETIQRIRQALARTRD